MTSRRLFIALVVGGFATGCIAPPMPSQHPDGASTSAGTGLGVGSLEYCGVNLTGAELGVDSDGNGALPGTFGVDYMYPDPSYDPGYDSPAYFLGRGMTVFKLPFRWERLQPTRNAPFDAAELNRLATTVRHLTDQGAVIILDPHNYARYGTDVIGSKAVPIVDFADFWSRLAALYANNEQVIFALMNAPHDILAEQWVNAANAAIAAIRAAGANNLILVPGVDWTDADTWPESNGSAMLAIADPAQNFAFEARQYLDVEADSVDQSCVSTTIGSERLQHFTTWLRANGFKGFLGEFGAGQGDTCLAALDDMLNHMEANQDVYVGWTYWAAGPWSGAHWTTIEPLDGADTPQMTVLEQHLGVAAPLEPTCSDGVQNGDETGVDCGGSCSACASTASCADGMQNGNETGVDCGGSCAACAPTCADGMQNGNEMGVDCGGSCAACAPTCADGMQNGNETGVDCGGSCAACAPTCADGIQNGNETGVDCGGSCAACAPTCSDGIQNGNEKGVDCGGSCAACAPTCSDGIQNGNEKGVDCGGSCAACAPTCSDGMQNGNETGVDCGGSCAACAPTCSDGIRNGNETGVDCGGSCSACPLSCVAATYEAETMYQSTGASVTDGWNIYSDGYISTDATFVGGLTTLTVIAFGDPAGGVGPHMVISVDGTPLGNTYVNSSSWASYEFTATITAGTHELRVTFDNDSCCTDGDRNLYVDKVVVSCSGG